MDNKYIYRYTDPSRNEAIYIGQGTQGARHGSTFRRAKSHLKRTDNHPLTHRLQKMAREGVQPIIDILIKGIDKELADLIEIEAIDKYGRKDLGKGTLLNLTNGGDGAHEFSETTRMKIGLAKKGKAKTPEHAAKISASMKGKNSCSFAKGVEAMAMKKRKPCTVDGVVIYPTVRALIKDLGSGKTGLRNPNFRYVKKESTDV